MYGKTLTRPELGPSFFLETQTQPGLKKTSPIRIDSGRKPTVSGFIVILIIYMNEHKKNIVA